MKKICTILTVAITGCFILLSTSRPAQALLDQKNFSINEIVGFAFCTLGKITPNFESWVKQSAEYTAAPPEAKKVIVENESNRLLQGIQIYNRDQDLLHITTPVKITSKYVADEPWASKSGIITQATLSIPEMAGFFFPFVVGPITIIVIPKDHEVYTNAYLNEKQTKSLYNNLGYAENAQPESVIEQIQAEFILRPVAVDIANPMKIGDKDMWLMLAEIASTSLWTADHQKELWNYKSPWYEKRKSNELLDLYGD